MFITYVRNYFCKELKTTVIIFDKNKQNTKLDYILFLVTLEFRDRERYLSKKFMFKIKYVFLMRITDSTRVILNHWKYKNYEK